MQAYQASNSKKKNQSQKGKNDAGIGELNPK